MWPSIVRFARRWWAPVAVMSGLLVAHLAVVWAVRSGQLATTSLLIKILVSVATPICLGCLAAYLTHRPAGFEIAWRLAGHRFAAPLAFVAMVARRKFKGDPSNVEGQQATERSAPDPQ